MWRLTELTSTVLLPPKEHSPGYLVLLPQGRAIASGGCNRLEGSYSHEGRKLEMLFLAATLLACPDAEDRQDQTVAAALSSVRGWKIDGRQLALLDRDGIVFARFDAAAPK